ncbi:hypothetical protein [Hymenobacter properus]|uniref:Uncharacterized protein n=1 Tax=Hymenobacter properus TaxID=2791026 RepID=A0A931BIK9_9BACT|nr:hypothetical protein [Hymenobacter properus]MBF9142027.1 hypothetical protein [Hymenobacter properus]MBR7720834.1 hypothetical protein [Microvirga sp. SRT04]
MFQHHLRHLLPHWPEVPPRLWLTAAGIGLVGLSLLFEQEIWPNFPQAKLWAWVALTLLLLAGGLQTIGVLLRWPMSYNGPRWLRLALGCLSVAVGLVVALVTLLLSLLSGLRAAFLSAG